MAPEPKYAHNHGLTPLDAEFPVVYDEVLPEVD